MTSHDLRDVLNLPQDGSGPRPAKKQKILAQRTSLKGLAREVQNLGGDNPIAIVPEVSVYKKRRQASRKPAARWEMRPFRNSARDDGTLILRHWRRKTEGDDVAPPQEDGDAPKEDGRPPAPGPEPMSGTGQDQGQLEDSAFAKFNVQVDIPQYNVDQYSSRLQHDDWTKDETDYLLELVKDFDLRWPLIWDRYAYSPEPPQVDTANGDSAAVVPVPKTRTMEDLKQRYYEVAAKMMAVQKPAQYMTQPEFTLYETMLNFDPVMETQRKRFAINSLGRSFDEAREEESLLLEVKRILARQERFNEERRDLYTRLDFPQSEQDINSFKSSQGLQTLLQNLMNADRSKKRKSLMGPDGVSPASAGPNGQPPPSAGGENRRESIAAVSASGHRDSIGGDKPTPTTEAPPKNNKKGGQAPERRKLTEQEEQVYGVSYHDRLSSGPTFRFERVNKLFSHKSGQQQARITNALGELDVPSRLTMPTAAVTTQFEQLVQTVTHLIDLRKQLDKLDGEIKIEKARRAADKDKDKAKVPADAQANGASSTTRDPPTATAEGEKVVATGAASASGPTAAPADVATLEIEKAVPDVATGSSTAVADANDAQHATNGDSIAADKNTLTNGHTTKGAVNAAKDDDAGDKEKTPTRPVSRPGSSGAHKRSASVLSTTSEKSTKRQKK